MSSLIIIPFVNWALRCLSLLCAGLLLSAVTFADGINGTSDELMDLSLEELLNVEVTSVSRRSQSLSTAAAAVFVVTQQDIRRSGATTIPEALRMVPGINVAQIDGNKWAVSARGANGRFAAKLLVLMDGRTIYTPLFSGVFWDVQDISLETIDRIEVIRGPGATLWGANAVNGIINIITKPAAATQGGYMNAALGSEGGSEASLRFGDSIGADANYRVYAKYHDRIGNQDLAGNPTADDWQSTRLGLRIDRENQVGDSLMFITEIYDGTMGATVFQNSLQPPYQSIADDIEEANGYFAQLAWSHQLQNNSEMTLQVYYDHSQRDGILYDRFTVDTIDLDIQHAFRAGVRHDIVWGLGYRMNDDETVNGSNLSMLPTERTQRWASAFVQDEIALIPENVYLTLGTKIEHNSFSQDGVEFEPNIRLRWDAGESGTAWASVSRAVRLPSRGDLDARLVSAVFPPLIPPNSTPVPLAVVLNGNPVAVSEKLMAYEIGYRANAGDNLVVDIAAFFHQHEDERSIAAGLPVCMPSGVSPLVDPLCVLTAQYVESPLLLGNSGALDSYGIEAIVDWTPANWWRMQAAMSTLKTRDKSAPSGSPLPIAIVQESPEFQASLRSMMNFRFDTEFDIWLRNTGSLPSAGIKSFFTVDVRLGWSPREELQIAVVGKNLLDDAHQEFISELADIVPVALERRAYIEASWSF